MLEIKGFKVRKPQYYLSNYIYKKLDDKENIEIIEASTGIGKTLSYLIPIMISGKKAIISTSTISLQNQIKNNEIKILNNIFQKKTLQSTHFKSQKNLSNCNSESYKYFILNLYSKKVCILNFLKTT